MNLETFFEKFELFADAPNAVAKMRDLVLELAVQGKLADQKRSDGDAAQLLIAISGERDARASTLRIPEEPASADNNGCAFEIPFNWVWTQLGNIALQIQYGYTASADPSVTEMRMLRITDIQSNRVDWPTVPGCHIEQGEAEKYLLNPNDILIARTGGTIGKSFIVPETPVKSVFASYLIRITPPRSMAARYLKTFMESPLYWAQLRQMSTGTGQPNVNGQALGRLAIPLPPLAEQQRIVAKVDELMALCDQLEAQQQERETRHAALARASLARFADAPTPANLDLLFHKFYSIPPADLRKSILTLAVQGKLVPQDPNDEPAEQLLMRVAEKRTALLQAGHPNRDESSVQLRKQQAQGLPQNLDPLSPGWVWATLMQASLLVVDCHNKTAPYVESGVRLLRTTNIRDGRLNDLQARFVDDVTYERWSARCKPAPGDILITREAPMGEVCIIPDGMKVCLGQRMMMIRLVQGTMEAKYILYSLMAPDLMDRVQDKPVGATVQHLRVGGVETLLTPIPPLAEQRRIVARVDELMALVDTLESRLATARTTAEKLMEAVVVELTTQD